MLAATAFPLGIAAAWRTRPHRRPPSCEPQKCVAARRAANLAFGAETRTRNHSAWAHLSRDISIKPLLYRKIRNQKPERWVPPKGSSHPEHAAVLLLPFDPFGIRLVNEGSFRRNDPSGEIVHTSKNQNPERLDRYSHGPGVICGICRNKQNTALLLLEVRRFLDS